MSVMSVGACHGGTARLLHGRNTVEVQPGSTEKARAIVSKLEAKQCVQTAIEENQHQQQQSETIDIGVDTWPN